MDVGQINLYEAENEFPTENVIVIAKPVMESYVPCHVTDKLHLKAIRLLSRSRDQKGPQQTPIQQ